MYKNPVPTVCVIVTNGDMVLLLQRPDTHPKAGTWCLPSGYLEHGESFYDAAVRELREETSLVTEKLEIFDHYSTYSIDGHHEVGIIFKALEFSGVVIVSEEHSTCRWFHLDNLPEFDNIILDAALDQFKKEGVVC